MNMSAVTGIAVSAIAVQVVGLGVIGWSLANSVRYLSAASRLEAPNGRKVAARAILWRTMATAVALISTTVGAGQEATFARALAVRASSLSATRSNLSNTTSRRTHEHA